MIDTYSDNYYLFPEVYRSLRYWLISLFVQIYGASTNVLADKLHPQFLRKILSKKVPLIHQCLH